MKIGLSVTLTCSVLAASCDLGGGCSGEWCGTLVIAQGADPDALFPPVIQTTAGAAVADLIYLKLADIGPSLNTVGDIDFIPRLAQSWSREDSLTWVFILDPQARWHDGVAVKAQDVEFTFSVYQDTLLASPKLSLLERIESVTARNASTVEFKFSSPYPEQFYDATHHMRILPSHLLDTIPPASLTSHELTLHPVGAGPYRFVRWDPAAAIELTADTMFFLGRPGLARLIFRSTPNIETALAQVLADEADVIEQLVTPENVSRAAAAPHVRLVEYRSSGYTYLQFNMRNPNRPNQPHPLLRDRTLRRALAMSVNQQEVVDAVLGGLGEVAIGPVSRMLSIWSEDIPRIPYDTARATTLLNRLGWADSDGDGYLDRSGQRLRFELAVPASSESRRQAAVIIQDQFRRVGVEMAIAELELNTLISRVTGGQFDAFFGFRTQDPSPATIKEAWTSSGIGGANFGRYSSAEFDRLVDAAIAEQRTERAVELWHQAVAHINADAPAIWLFSPKSVAAVHRRIDNVTIRPDQWTATIWTWRVPSARIIDRDRYGSN